MIKVSVITAVYNRSSTIGQALDSVLSQRHAAVESIVIDGGSTDGTLEVIGRYRDRLGTVVSERDNGIYDALNKGLRMATGDVIGFMHADDKYADVQVLSDVATRFADPAVDAVYGDLVYVDATDTEKIVRLWTAGDFEPSLLRRGWMPPHPTLYVRRTRYQQVGGFDTRYRIAADYDHMVRLLSTPGLQVDYVPRVLVRMRVGGVSNRSPRTVWLKSLEDLDIIRRHGLGGLGTLMIKNLGKLHQFWKR